MKLQERERGFTLVELAIVMVIIGLLIGGILKGQELINNARVHATISDIRGLKAAMAGFYDRYEAVPGDMIHADTMLNDCTQAPCLPATSVHNGRVDYDFDGSPTSEADAVFAQLKAAGFITSVAPETDVALGHAWGGDFPSAPVGGGFHFGYAVGNERLPGQYRALADEVKAGHYLALNADAHLGITAETDGALTVYQAAQIDRKMDDGITNKGRILAAIASAPSIDSEGCIPFIDRAPPQPVDYNEGAPGNVCNLYIWIQP